MKRSLTLLLLLVGIGSIQPLFAQQQNERDKAQRYLEQHATEWGLEVADLVDVIVSDQYVSAHNGAKHFYFVQRYASIPVYGTVTGVHLSRRGEIVSATPAFEPHLAERINTATPATTAYQALTAALADCGVHPTQPLALKEQQGSRYTFAGGAVAHNDIVVKLRYLPVLGTDEIRLCWDMAIDLANSADYWSLRVDAVTNKVIHRHNYTIYCNFDAKDKTVAHADHCAHQWEGEKVVLQPATAAVVDGTSAYRVFPVPIESPIHGERQLVIDPADPIASPFGWHDVNGMPGPEYTITRGNNTHAYLDAEDMNTSLGDEPDGTADLNFDFYFDVDDEPENMQPAEITQMFYMVNMMHDITFAYGFNEEAGNFQRRNYSGAMGGNDHVFAEAQDGSGTNNANFSTPPDGANGRMQMYLWQGVAGRVLTIDSPASVAGSYESGTASYGPQIPEIPIVGQVIRAYDASGSPFIACEEIANAAEVSGKIALIDRGSCFFEEKTLRAEAAGAIAVIICNYEEEALGMAGGVDNADPSIPTVSMKASDCNRLKLQLELDVVVTASIGRPADSGATKVGSGFDNGVVAHEYGHGISNRLTGGPGADDCLTNNEQMGEGWSDFFALITSVRPGDTGATLRGIGNYSDRKPADGTGIRRKPYSTDFAINNHDMDDIVGTTAPHDLGEVWATAIWDLYWAMVDQYGFDPDLINGTGGNNIAIQLVMDGMALQRCNPGIMDGRDALITADYLNAEGANECLIWEVFARRGMGFGANQGSRNTRDDNRKDFSILPACIKELKIEKSADQGLIIAGENITFTLVVSNDKEETATGVVVQDELPSGLTLVPGSVMGATVTNNGTSLTFGLGEIAPETRKTITYQVTTNANVRSIQQFYDGMENGDGNWEFENPTGFDIWDITSINPNSGTKSWYVANGVDANDQILLLSEAFEVAGLAPTLRFYHDYNTQPATDGGFVQVSTNGGTSWNDVPASAFIRNSYRGRLASRTLFTPNILAFWGDSDGYVDSYIDLSAYQGQTIQVRFRFASDDGIGAEGWYLDDFELMDKIAYEGEACVSSNEGDLGCARVPAGGVIVDTKVAVGTDNPVYDPEMLQVYPNPARTTLNIALGGELPGTLDVQLISASGVVVRQWRNQSLPGQLLPLNISDIPAGFYFVQVNTKAGIFTAKVTIQ
ncbi:MAG: hypothetical protein DA408_04915 [Bacteroidetes bacterium]|nr:MAG: hypothetical protein C7N36_03870 [Bacteroidota bacterium]PTM13942.1 MAG: hypothetical protein DA408_04915 [Bacteroidota bacterium]